MKRRHLLFCFRWRNLTNVYMVENLPWSLTIDHWYSFLGPTKAVPILAAAQIQRWAITLSAYDKKICYKKSAENANSLSLLPSNANSEDESEIDFFVMPINYQWLIKRYIGLATKFDPTLSKILEYVRPTHKWRNKINRLTLINNIMRRHNIYRS